MILNERYEILRELGRGRSMVFLCSDKFNDDKPTALKILPKESSEEEKAALRKEYFLHRNFSHPNIAEVYEFGNVFSVLGNGSENLLACSFITSEFIEGRPIDEFGQISEQLLVNWIMQICSALQYIHQSNYIYYDLKPENILFNPNTGTLKLIDFGLAERAGFNTEFRKKGSVEYISPEIIAGEVVDHRTDFYSLGILLFKITQSSFPFESNDELTIYKTKLSGNLSVNDTRYSERIRSLISKLLMRNPTDRPFTSMQILSELGKEHKVSAEDLSTARNFYSGEAFKKLTDRLKSGRITSLLIKGAESSGKTELLKHFEEVFRNSVRFMGGEYLNEISPELWMLNKLQEISTHFDKSDESISGGKESPRTLFFNKLAALSGVDELVLLFDGFQDYDEFLEDFVFETVQFCQINGIRIVISADANFDFPVELRNFEVFSIWPLPKKEIREFVNHSLAYFFPRDEVAELLIDNSDKTPGGLYNFLQKLFSRNLIDVYVTPPALRKNPSAVRQIKREQEEILSGGLLQLTPSELLILQTLALFQFAPPQKLLKSVLSEESVEFEKSAASLCGKGWLKIDSLTGRVNFVNPSAKKAVYESIENSSQMHADLYAKSQNSGIKLPFNEEFYQLERAENYDGCFKKLIEHLNRDAFSQAYLYKKLLIKRLLNHPVSPENRFVLFLKLSEIKLKTGEYSEVLNLVKRFESKFYGKNLNQLLRIKAEALIGTGESKMGAEILERLSNHYEGKEKIQVLLTLAVAMLDLNKYSRVRELCEKITNSEDAGIYEYGKCSNILALAHIQENESYSKAKDRFIEAEKLFEKGKFYNDQASVAVNLGNIFNIEGEKNRATEYWNKALKLTRITGNVEREAQILMNEGVLEFEGCDFDKAADHYLRAKNIFSTFGNKSGVGLACSNLGELYTLTCEYSKAIECLGSAASIFGHIDNRTEQIIVLMNKIRLYDDLQFLQERDSLISEFSNKVIDWNLAKKFWNLSGYWSLIANFNGLSNPKINSSEIKSKLERCLSEDYNVRSADLIVRLLFILVNKNEFGLFHELLNVSSIIKYLNFNPYFKAWLNFLKSRVATGEGKADEGFQHLGNAYNLLTDINITRLTWLVLADLTKLFNIRGDYKRTGDYLSMANDVMNFIVQNLTPLELEDKFLNLNEQKEIIEELRMIEDEIFGAEQ